MMFSSEIGKAQRYGPIMNFSQVILEGISSFEMMLTRLNLKTKRSLMFSTQVRLDGFWMTCRNHETIQRKYSAAMRSVKSWQSLTLICGDPWEFCYKCNRQCSTLAEQNNEEHSDHSTQPFWGETRKYLFSHAFRQWRCGIYLVKIVCRFVPTLTLLICVIDDQDWCTTSQDMFCFWAHISVSRLCVVLSEHQLDALINHAWV